MMAVLPGKFLPDWCTPVQVTGPGAVTEGADNRKAIRRLCTLPFVAHCQRANLRSWRDPAGKGSTDTHNATSGTRYRLTWGDQAT